jgi:hypothetical protein
MLDNVFSKIVPVVRKGGKGTASLLRHTYIACIVISHAQPWLKEHNILCCSPILQHSLLLPFISGDYPPKTLHAILSVNCTTVSELNTQITCSDTVSHFIKIVLEICQGRTSSVPLFTSLISDKQNVSAHLRFCYRTVSCLEALYLAQSHLYSNIDNNCE